MKRLSALLILMTLIGVCGFAGGKQEATEAAAQTATKDGKELGEVINAQYGYVNPRTGESGTVTIDRFKASPQWKSEVEAGALPPVDERLPDQPLVIEPIESIGKYGGIMYTLRTPNYLNTLSQRLQLEHLVTWTTPSFEHMNPNVARDWVVSDDARTFTFYLREGMKWSDGTPFSADAIMWWYENILLNDELYPGKPAFMKSGDEVGAVRKVDDYTVQFIFPQPNPMFIDNAARIRPMPYAPAHYLEQFHADHTSEAKLGEAMAEDEYDTWTDLFFSKWNFYGNPDIPSISGWVAINGQEEQVLKIRRNPYYWKVDTEGNQLPYIDGMDHEIISNNEAWLLKAMAGELTYAQSGFIGGPKNLPILLQNREKGDYRIVYGFWPPNNLCTTYFNFTNPDEVKREIINNRDFRLAMMKAINWEDVNEIIYEGEADVSWPKSVAPYDPDDPVFTKYIEYDPSEANSLLDGMGLASRDREGFRLAPNGEKLTLVVLARDGWPDEAGEVAELYRGYWAEVGIRAVVKVQSNQLIGQMLEAGDYDLNVSVMTPGGRPMNIFTRGALLPSSNYWGVSRDWAAWIVSDGEEGVEPPSYVKRLGELYDMGMVEPDDERRKEYIMEAFDITIDNLLVIPGFSQPQSFTYAVVKNNLRNVNVPGEPMSLEHHTTPSQIYYFDD
jgi:peptide/nickel transport system substrate-binding protein